MPSVDHTNALVLVGAGRMGGALLKGWIAHQATDLRIVVVEPNPAEDIQALASDQVSVVTSLGSVPAGVKSKLLVLAVKPQMMAQALPPLNALCDESTIVVSVAAGTTLRNLSDALPAAGFYVRVMPNTPAQVSAGMSVGVVAKPLGEQDQTTITRLFEAVGLMSWVDDEAQMDAVTALSGSGPAYVFHLVEAMADAGVALGLPAETAMTLARQTVVGGGALLAEAQDGASRLRENVTSPGGTTAAALEHLMAQDNGLGALMRQAMQAAAKRSQELAG